MQDKEKKIDLKLPKFKDNFEKGRLQFFAERGDKSLTGGGEQVIGASWSKNFPITDRLTFTPRIGMGKINVDIPPQNFPHVPSHISSVKGPRFGFGLKWNINKRTYGGSPLTREFKKIPKFHYGGDSGFPERQSLLKKSQLEFENPQNKFLTGIKNFAKDFTSNIKTKWGDFKEEHLTGSGAPVTKDRQNIWGQDVQITGQQGFLGLKNRRKFVEGTEVTGQNPFSKQSGTGRSIYDVNLLGKYIPNPDEFGNNLISSEDYNERKRRDNIDFLAEKEYRNKLWAQQKAEKKAEFDAMKLKAQQDRDQIIREGALNAGIDPTELEKQISGSSMGWMFKDLMSSEYYEYGGTPKKEKFDWDKDSSEESSWLEGLSNVANWKDQLLKNLNPRGYSASGGSSVIKRLLNTIWKGQKEGGRTSADFLAHTYENPDMETTKIENQRIKSGVPTGESRLLIEKERQDLLALVLGKPQIHNTITESLYRPTITKEDDSDVIYYSSPVTESQIIRYMRNNKDADIKDFYGDTLGNFTIDQGEDEKGKYISYYDVWNLNPTPIGDEFVDSVLGLTPPEIYGRVYLDDITGVDPNPDATQKEYEKRQKTAIHGKHNKDKHGGEWTGWKLMKYGGAFNKRKEQIESKYRSKWVENLDRSFKKLQYGGTDGVPFVNTGQNPSYPQNEVNYNTTNPESRGPQNQLNAFITQHVIPDYGGSVTLWKQILNEIAYHESGKFQVFDPNAKQLIGSSLTPTGKANSFAQIEGRTAWTNLKRTFQRDFGTDLFGTFWDRGSNRPIGLPYVGEYGDTLTWTHFPELENLYYKKLNVQTIDPENPREQGTRQYSDTTYTKGDVAGWTEKSQKEREFDVRQLSPESIGILQLMQLIGSYNKKDNPKHKLSDYFVNDIDGEPMLNTADIRSKIWGEHYQTEYNNEDMALFKVHAKEFNQYPKDHRFWSKYSWPEGYTGSISKEEGTYNYAPFYDHKDDILNPATEELALKNLFQDYFGANLDSIAKHQPFMGSILEGLGAIKSKENE